MTATVKEAPSAIEIIGLIMEEADDIAGFGRALLVIAESAGRTDIDLGPALCALAYAIEDRARKVHALADEMPIGRKGGEA